MESNWSKLVELVSIEDDKFIANSKELEKILNRSIEVHFVFNPLDPKSSSGLIQAFIEEDDEESHNSLSTINPQQLKPSIMGQFAITRDDDVHLFLCILGVSNGESPHYKALAGIALHLCDTAICVFNKEIKTSNLSWLQDCLAFTNAIEEDKMKMHRKFFVLVTNWDSTQNLPYGTTGGLKYFETVRQFSGTKLSETFLENWALDCTLLPDEDNEDFEMTFTEIKEGVLSHINLPKDSKQVFQPLLNPSKLQDLFQLLDIQSYPSTSPPNEGDKLGDAMQGSSGFAPEKDESQTPENYLTIPNLDYEKLSNQSNDDGQFMMADVQNVNNNIHQVEELENQSTDFSQLNDLASPIEKFEDLESSQDAVEEIEKYWEQNMDFNFDSETSEACSFNVDFLDINESLILEDATTFKPQKTKKIEPEVESNQQLHTDIQRIEKPESAEELISRLFQHDTSSNVKLPQITLPIIKKVAVSNQELKPEAHYKVAPKAMELSKVQEADFKDDTFKSINFPTASSISAKQEENGTDNFQRRILEKGMEYFGKLRLNSTVNFNELVSKIESTTFGSLAKTPFSNKENFELTNLYLRNSLEFIVAYLDEMDKRFEKIVYFRSSQELQKTSEKVMNNIVGGDLNIVKATFGDFFPLIQDKIKIAESEYAKINAALQKAEQNSRNEALKLIFHYIDQETETGKISKFEKIQDLENLEENLKSLCQSAFIQAIASFNKTLDVEWIEKIRRKIDSTFFQLRDKMELKFRKNNADKMLKDQKSADFHVSNYAQKYKSRLDDAIRSPTFNPNHFAIIQEDAENDIFREFNSAISDLSTEMQKKSLDRLKIEIEESTRQAHQKIKSKLQKPGYSIGSLQVAGSSSKQSTNEVKELTPVGVHFSFDSLSASTVNIDGTFRQLYGPAPNNIIIGDELSIGKFDATNGEISLREVLMQPSIEKWYYCKFDKIRIETLIAYVLSILHLHVISILGTQRISYLIAIPSSFNLTMWKVFNNSIQIAGINAKLLRESCGLLVAQLEAKALQVQPTAKKLVVLIEDFKTDSCEEILYDTTDKALRIESIRGRKADKGFTRGLLGITPAIEVALNSIPDDKRKMSAAVILLCTKDKKNRNVNLIKKIFPTSVKLTKAHPQEILKGTSILSAYGCNESFKASWDRRHSTFKLDGLLTTENTIFGNLSSTINHHSGREIPKECIDESNGDVQAVLVNLQKELQDAKKWVQEQCIILIQNNQENEEVENELNKVLREIRKEAISAANVKLIFNEAKDKLKLY